MKNYKIAPYILSGGAGSRLWPLSRQSAPKQLLPLVTDETMAQETAARFAYPEFTDIVFICNARHVDPITAQMRAINHPVEALITEPVGRNTAPCAVVAALHAKQTHGDALVILAPADHHVTKPDAFRTAIMRAAPIAAKGHIVTFGIMPDSPDTGYGYIEQGAALAEGVFKVKAFREKPDAQTAQAYLNAGNFSWNAGLFLFDPNIMLEDIQAFAPDIYAQTKEAYEKAKRDGVSIHLDKDAFSQSPSDSLDYAVMERTQRAAIVPVDMGWSDIGSYAALKDVRVSGDDNAVKGDVMTYNTSQCLIQTDGPMVATVGVEDLAVIIQDGKVMIARLSQSQDVKKIVEKLKADGRLDDL